MIHTVILDLDGPILDGQLRHYACYRQILTAHGYIPVDAATYWRMKRERVDRRQLLAASKAEAIYEEFLSEWLALIESPALLALDRLQPGVPARFIEWKNAGIVLVLATMRSQPERLDAQLKVLVLRELFEYVIVSPHRLAGTGKARKVRETVVDLNPADCLWIGDTEIDVEAGRSMGCPVWAVTCGLRTESYLSSLSPDFLSTDLTTVDLRRCNGR